MTADRPLQVVLVANLGNPLAGAWRDALMMAGHTCVVLDYRDEEPATDADLRRWLVDPEAVVHYNERLTGTVRGRIEALLDGPVDAVVGWWGHRVLAALRDLRGVWPDVPYLHVLNCFPDAATIPTHGLEVLRYWGAASAVDGWVHYSDRMHRRFVQAVPIAARDPWLAMLEAFPSTAYSDDGVTPQEDVPSIVFSGRTDLLFDAGFRMAKDRIGPFLLELQDHGAEVFISDSEDGDANRARGLHTHPFATNAELFDGTYARMLNGFDLQLVAYNEATVVQRWRVSAGLSTRLASAMTSSTPIAVSRSTSFMADEWQRTGAPFGFGFRDGAHLVDVAKDRAAMSKLRANAVAHRREHALDRRMDDFAGLVRRAAAARREKGPAA